MLRATTAFAKVNRSIYANIFAIVGCVQNPLITYIFHFFVFLFIAAFTGINVSRFSKKIAINRITFLLFYT